VQLTWFHSCLPTCIITGGGGRLAALSVKRLEAGLGRFIARLVTSMLLAGFSPSSQASLNESNSVFESADLLSAKDIPYPVQSIAIGTVVLEATVSESGNVEDVQPIREIPSLTDVAIESVKSWHFKPASLDGRPVRSRTAVAVAFNPAAAPVANVPLPPLSTNPRSSGPALLQPEPVEVTAATLPQYPANSVTTGTVVLRVRVDESGNAESITAVRRIPSLTSQCIRVVKEWKFTPAKFRGRPTPSSIALAFVLRPPASSN
jgi:outer membrane biosynthesis protein TonB